MSSTSLEAPAGDAAASHHGERLDGSSTMRCEDCPRRVLGTVLFHELWKVRTDP
jgi:hypothetical protein